MENEILTLIHEKEYIEGTKAMCGRLAKDRGIFVSSKDLYFCQQSYLAALICTHAVV